jgi:hypothetical protein
MTPSELKYNVENSGNEPYFFTRSTMKFFGDTMGNYGCRKITIFKTNQEVWELYRKRPVKHGLDSSAYFHTITFERIHRVKE